METKGTRLRTNFLNPYDEVQFNFGGTDFYDDKLWSDMYKGTTQDINQYISFLQRQDKLDINYMDESYRFKDLSSNGKMLAMAAELDADNVEKKNYSIVVGYDENGKEIKETRNLTEKEYYQTLLKYEKDAIIENERLQAAQQYKDNMSTFDKIVNTIGGVAGEFVLGGTDQVFSILNFVDALAEGFGEVLEWDWSAALSDFRGAMADNRIGQMDMGWYDDISNSLREWEGQATYLARVTGERTYLGRTLGSAAYSMGQALTSSFLTAGVAGAAGGIAKGSKAYSALYRTMFYTGSSSSALQERFRDPAFNSTSTMAIIGETALKTAGQIGVEIGLEKILGAGFLDELTRGVKASGSSAYPVLSFIGNMAKEGAEEGIQEFSDWFIDAFIAYGDKENPFYSEWSWQNVGDAIMAGMLSSGLSGIVTTSVNAYKKNKLATELGIKDSKEYQALTDKKSKRKYVTGVLDMMRNYQQLVKDADFYTYTKEGMDEKFQASKELYNAFNIIMNMYGAIGQERATKAEALLKELETAYNEKQNYYAIEQSKQFAKTLSENWKYVATVGKINSDTTKRIKDKLDNLKKDDLKTRINAAFENGEFVGDKKSTDKLNDNAKSVANKLSKDGIDVLATDAKRIVGNEDTILASTDNLNNMSSEELLKAATEDDFANTLVSEMDAVLLEEIRTVYNQIYKEGKNDNDLLMMYKLLYDGSTFNIMLMHSSRRMFSFMTNLYKLAEDISKRDLRKEFNKQYLLTVKRLKKNLGTEVILYCCQHTDTPYADLEFLTAEQKAYIERNRYNGYVRDRVANNTMTEQDVNLLHSRINSAPFFTEDEKQSVRDDLNSNSKPIRLRGLRKLDEVYNYTFFGVFNDEIYPAGTDVKNCILTDFLMTNGIDLRYIKKGFTNDEIRKNTEATLGGYDEIRKITYLQRLFNNFTNGDYALKISRVGNKIVDVYVVERTNVTYDYATKGQIARERGDFVPVPSDNKVASKLLNEHLNKNLSTTERTYVTIDDVIKYPNKYLSNKTIEAIKNDYGSVNKNTAFTYFRELLSDENSTIIETVDGNYVIATYEYIDNFVKDKLSISKIVYDKEYTAKDFYKIENLPEELQDVKIIFQKGLDNPYYSHEEKTIRLPKPQTTNTFKITLMHEMYHAMSVVFNFSQGFTSSIPVTQNVVSDIRSHIPALFENVPKNQWSKVAQNYIYANVSGELLAYGAYDVAIDVIPIVFDNRTNTLKMPWGSKYYVGKNIDVKSDGQNTSVKQELTLKGSRGSDVEVLDDEKIKTYNDAFTKDDLLNPKSVEFKRMLTYYRKRYLEINIKSGWSGYLGNAGMEEFIHNSLNAQDKEDLRRYYWMEKFNNVTYEEFLNMDIPIIRYNEGQKLLPNAKIRGNNMYKYRTHYSAFNGTDYKLLLDYFKLKDTEDGNTDYLYFGVIKPKDVPVMIPSGEREILVPENTFLNDCTVVPIKYIDGVAYVHEKGDKPLVYLTNNVKKKVLNKMADLVVSELKQSLDVWTVNDVDRKMGVLPNGVSVIDVVTAELQSGSRSFIPISTNELVSPYYITDMEHSIPVYHFPVNTAKLGPYIKRFKAADKIHDYLNTQCITFGKDYITLPPAFLKLTPTKAYDVLIRLSGQLLEYYKNLDYLRVMYLSDKPGESTDKIYSDYDDFFNDYFKNIHYITEVTNKQNETHKETDYFHDLSPERIHYWINHNDGAIHMLQRISELYDGDLTQSEGIVLHEIHVPLSNTPTILRTQMAMLKTLQIRSNDGVGKKYLKPYGYFKTVNGITTTYTLKKDVPIDESDFRITEDGAQRMIDDVKRKIVTKKQIDEKLLEFNKFDYAVDFERAKVIVQKLLKFLHENNNVLSYEKFDVVSYKKFVDEQYVFILPGQIAVYPKGKSFAGFSSFEFLKFVTTKLSEEERLSVQNNTLEIYRSIYFNDVCALTFNEEFLPNIRDAFINVVDACFELNLGVAVSNALDDDEVFTNDEYSALDVYDIAFDYAHIKQEALIKQRKEYTKQEYDEAVDYIKKINNATQLVKTSKNPEKSMEKVDLPAETKQKILDNTYYKSKDATYTRYLTVKRSYENRLRAVERKKELAKQRKEEAKRKKAAGETYGKRYAISKKMAGDSNLKYFTNTIYPQRHERNFINFVEETTDNLDKLPEEIADRILNGTLNQDTIYEYVRKATNINDYTFKLIKKHFFPDSPFETYADLTKFLTSDLAYLYAIKGVLEEHGYDELVTNKFDYKDTVTYKDTDGTIKKRLRIVEHFLNIPELAKEINEKVEKFGTGWYYEDVWKKGQIPVDYGNGQLVALKYFDGTIFGGNKVANKIMYTGRFGYASQYVGKEKPLSFNKQLDNAKGDEGLSLEERIGEEETQTDYISLEVKRERLVNRFIAVLNEFMDTVNKSGQLSLKDAFNLMNLMTLKYKSMTKQERQKYASKVISGIYNTKTNSFIGQGYKKLITKYRTKINERSEDEISRLYAIHNIAQDYAVDEVTIDILTENSKLKERSIKIAKDAYRNLFYRNMQYVNTKNYKYLPEEYKKFFVLEKNKVKYNPDAIKNKSPEEVDALRETAKLAFRLIRKGYFENAQSVKLWKEVEKERTARLKAEQKAVKTKISAKGKVSYVTEIKSKTFEIQSEQEIPDKLKKMLDTTFDKERKSTTKFMAEENETHMVISSKQFFKDNAELLNNLTVDEVREIVNYYSSALVLPGNVSDVDLIRFDTFKTMLYAWFINRYNEGTLYIEDELVSKMKSQLEFSKRRAGTDLSTWRNVLYLVKPTEIIAQQLFHELGIEIDDAEFDPLTAAVVSGDIDKIRAEQEKLYKKILEIYKGNPKNLRKAFDKMRAIQRASQLSGPATIVRAHTSNIVLKGINKFADWIGAKLAKGSKKAYTLPNQYNLTGVKVTDDVKTWIDDELINNGYLDLITDGLSKFDIRDLDNVNVSTNSVVKLIIANISSAIKTENVLDNKYLSKWTKFVSKLQSDAPYINKQFISYLGRIIVSTGLDYKQGIKSPEVLDAIVSAYNMAAYDYVHRKNWVSDVENKFAQKAPKAYMAYKLVMPYLPSTYNWFVEMLDLTPFALIKNIRDLCQLEKKIATMEDLQRKGEYVPYDPRFVEMITRRKVGKGIIGTVLTAIGLGLGALGVIGVDDDDEKLKLFVPGTDIRIDISKQYGTSSLLIGAQLANPKKGSWFNVVEDVFNMTLEDWTLTSIIDTFRYSDGVFDAVSEMPLNVAAGFIPNLYKSVVRMVNYKKIEYSKGLLGNLEYLAYSMIPGSYNWLNTSIDPYTGEEQVRYSNNWFVNILNEFLPTKLYTYKMSDAELTARSYGVNKASLKGVYEDIGKIDNVMLNKKYGELNNKDLNDFINDKVLYEVEDKNGRKLKLKYSKMSDEQKESVLTRIMNKNAQYAKIYVWTQSGHKYYCSSSKRAELLKVGITQNILIGNKGFVN